MEGGDSLDAETLLGVVWLDWTGAESVMRVLRAEVALVSINVMVLLGGAVEVTAVSWLV